MPKTLLPTDFDYRALAEAILAELKSDRDRQIVAQRYSLGLDKRQTLEAIGSDFGITRERVRQIEKSATAKLRQSSSAELKQIDDVLRNHVHGQGHIALLDEVAAAVGANTPAERAYISFLASLAPSIELVDENDHYFATLALLPDYHKRRLTTLTDQMVKHLHQQGKPLPIDAIQAKVSPETPPQTLHNLARATKKMSHLDGYWGLSHWPQVNPRSIRDKTYLVLGKHGQPLHFTDIASQIAELGERKRDVTVQAVHNELIKDPRFVLVGRGIYALAEWGYTPGTVADIISDILKQESPLHKDEIVKRVLAKRKVKSTTIVLNLQEKDQFVRVSKATYALR
ncbi:hypothetical protein EPO04_01580 [Patescibacteria group bacterium]|nr:MAG: hypothetical protein EPO04_01580 [Patescibacteria group bacterium]